MNPKIGLLIVSLVIAVIGIYGIELSTRVSKGTGRPEYLAVVLIVLASLLLVDWRFYRSYKRDNKEK